MRLSHTRAPLTVALTKVVTIVSAVALSVPVRIAAATAAP